EWRRQAAHRNLGRITVVVEVDRGGEHGDVVAAPRQLQRVVEGDVARASPVWRGGGGDVGDAGGADGGGRRGSVRRTTAAARPAWPQLALVGIPVEPSEQLPLAAIAAGFGVALMVIVVAFFFDAVLAVARWLLRRGEDALIAATGGFRSVGRGAGRGAG